MFVAVFVAKAMCSAGSTATSRGAACTLVHNVGLHCYAVMCDEYTTVVVTQPCHTTLTKSAYCDVTRLT